MNFRSTVSEGRARGENADVSEGGRRRCTESVTCRGQSDISSGQGENSGPVPRWTKVSRKSEPTGLQKVQNG